jgi:hypothetical protein
MKIMRAAKKKAMSAEEKAAEVVKKRGKQRFTFDGVTKTVDEWSELIKADMARRKEVNTWEV